jgi:hypothetical protein
MGFLIINLGFILIKNTLKIDIADVTKRVVIYSSCMLTTFKENTLQAA